METAASGPDATERAETGVNEVNQGEATGLESIGPSVEAILIGVDKPVSAAAIALALNPPALSRVKKTSAGDEGEAAAPEEQPPKADPGAVRGVEEAIRALNESYAQTGRSFRIEHVAGGYRVMTLPQHARAVAAFHRSRQSTRLTKAAVETLAIIAYKQPITRADLEAIRGVACGEVLRSLLDRRLVTIKGRAEELGRPLLYGTTKQFLDAFGLASLIDLPQIAELKPGTEAKV